MKSFFGANPRQALFLHSNKNFFTIGELMIIVEYCPFGNIQDFLRRNREKFVDQIDPDTDEIDGNILQNSVGNSQNR